MMGVGSPPRGSRFGDVVAGASGGGFSPAGCLLGGKRLGGRRGAGGPEWTWRAASVEGGGQGGLRIHQALGWDRRPGGRLTGGPASQ